MAAPPIVSRAQWGASTTVPGGRNVAPSTRRNFIVHWPVMAIANEEAAIRAIERQHFNQWRIGPGYNLLVGQSGRAFMGCGVNVRGVHAGNRNTDSYGVCVLQPSTAAGRPTAALTQAARNTTRALYEWLSTQSGRRLAMSWHGQHMATACPGPDLIAWVRAGMPATGGVAPPPPTPQAEELNMLTSETAANGSLHVWRVAPNRRSVVFTVQRGNETNWGGGQAGQAPAGWSGFADAPQGRTIVGITAKRSASNVLGFWMALDNGDTRDCWQRPNETAWLGRDGRQLRLFARAP